MNLQLITPAEVLEIAFPSNEYLSEELITPGRIESAALQFIRPVLGAFYDVLGETRYESFTHDFIKPALAYYVRYLMIDDRAAQIAPHAVIQHRTDLTQAATEQQLERLRRQARHDADILLQKAVDRIETYPADFPEYDSDENIRHRITFQGGFIL